MDTAQFTQLYLMYVVMPLWLLAGVADWLCHRAARIEFTTGFRESLIHLLMLAEAAVPILIALFFEITGLVILIMTAAWLLHEVTSFWDVSYASSRREVSPIEQRVHDYLGVIPFLALSLVLVLNWPQLLALFGLGPETLDLSLRWREPPLPVTYVVLLLAAVALLDVLPFLQELWRGLRARRRPESRRIGEIP